MQGGLPPGLEFEPPSGTAYHESSQNSFPSPASSVHSVQSVDISSPHNGHLRRRAPHHGSNNGPHFSPSGAADADDGANKYARRTTRAVRQLDFFPKVERDLQVRTERGGQFALAGYGIMLVLVLAEFWTWTNQNGETLEHIVVDKSLGKRMRVNLNITFPALHCDDLHLDVIDVAGDTQLDLSDTLFKHRLGLDGTPLSVEKIATEANIKAEEDKKKRDILKANLPDDYCGPCYGAQINQDDCCNTCDEVMEHYRKKRWNELAVMPLAEQCIREGRAKTEPKRMSGGEGCNLSGYMTVNRVAGNFHIAMGEGVDRDGRHIHQFLPEDRPNFNASHYIYELTFGDEEYNGISTAGSENSFGLPGEKTMNGLRKVVTEVTGTTGLFQYFIKVVPTKYKGEILDDFGVGDTRSDQLETNRYFYTERFRPLIGEVHEEAILSGDPDRGMAGAHVGGKVGGSLHDKVEHHDTQNAVLPGVFFVYEIYPFAVEVTKNKVPLMHLLVRIMAAVGGVFTIMGWVDGVYYSRQKGMR